MVDRNDAAYRFVHEKKWREEEIEKYIAKTTPEERAQTRRRNLISFAFALLVLLGISTYRYLVKDAGISVFILVAATMAVPTYRLITGYKVGFK